MTRLTTLNLPTFHRSMIGFDSLFEEMDRMFENSTTTSGGYPPYNIAKINEVSKQIESEIQGIEKLSSIDSSGRFVRVFKDPLNIRMTNHGVITDVGPTGDAAAQGVVEGDTIVSIDGVPLRLLYAHTKQPSEREISTFINQARKSEGQVRICFSRSP